VTTTKLQIGEGAVGAFATLCRASAVHDLDLLAADAAKRSRFFAGRSRKLLRLLLEDPSLGRTIGEAIHDDAVSAAEWANEAVKRSVEADEARIELENAEKDEANP
jgi:hypothetical protein